MEGDLQAPRSACKDLVTAPLISRIHLHGRNAAGVYLPLCCKPSILMMLNNDGTLLERYICHCLTATTADVLIFIADGDVMNEALLALGTSPARAQRLTASLSTQLRAKVDAVVAKLGDARIKGVVHWADVANNQQFQATLEAMQIIMAMDGGDDDVGAIPPLGPAPALIQHDVKTLVKALFTQRVNKARSAGHSMTNVFTGDGLSMLSGTRYVDQHLERACLLELCNIMVGQQHGAQNFTEMAYLTDDPEGMTHIIACLQNIRRAIPTLPAGLVTAGLQAAAAEVHGVTFVRTN